MWPGDRWSFSASSSRWQRTPFSMPGAISSTRRRRRSSAGTRCDAIWESVHMRSSAHEKFKLTRRTLFSKIFKNIKFSSLLVHPVRHPDLATALAVLQVIISSIALAVLNSSIAKSSPPSFRNSTYGLHT